MSKFKIQKQVVMEATFAVHTMDEIDVESLIARDLAYMDIGSFCFIKDGKEVPFDFEATARTFGDHGLIIYGNFDGFPVRICDVDPYYAIEYEKLGLSMEDITAEFLAAPEKIEEFTFRLCDEQDNQITCALELQKIIFINEKSQVFSVPEKLLYEYNARMCVEELMMFNEGKTFLKDLSRSPESVLADKKALDQLVNQVKEKSGCDCLSDTEFRKVQFYLNALRYFSLSKPSLEERIGGASRKVQEGCFLDESASFMQNSDKDARE